MGSACFPVSQWGRPPGSQRGGLTSLPLWVENHSSSRAMRQPQRPETVRSPSGSRLGFCQVGQTDRWSLAAVQRRAWLRERQTDFLDVSGGRAKAGVLTNLELEGGEDFSNRQFWLPTRHYTTIPRPELPTKYLPQTLVSTSKPFVMHVYLPPPTILLTCAKLAPPRGGPTENIEGVKLGRNSLGGGAFPILGFTYHIPG